MPLKYKNKQEFVSLDDSKKTYYLARLYLLKDKSKKSRIPYKNRLFMCINYLKKQPKELLSILYNYLSDTDGHNGLTIWEIVPLARFYDNERRRLSNVSKEKYKDFDQSMLCEILGDDKTWKI